MPRILKVLSPFKLLFNRISFKSANLSTIYADCELYWIAASFAILNVFLRLQGKVNQNRNRAKAVWASVKVFFQISLQVFVFQLQ